MIDNVATGPVTLKPGDQPKIDARAWEAYSQLTGRCTCTAVPYHELGADGDTPCVCCLMLMHYEPSGRFGRLVAAFKHRFTRRYYRVSFGYSSPEPQTREPQWEPLRDHVAAQRYLVEVESAGIRSPGVRAMADATRKRALRLGALC